jgi:hypothetical protein
MGKRPLQNFSQSLEHIVHGFTQTEMPPVLSADDRLRPDRCWISNKMAVDFSLQIKVSSYKVEYLNLGCGYSTRLNMIWV